MGEVDPGGRTSDWVGGRSEVGIFVAACSLALGWVYSSDAEADALVRRLFGVNVLVAVWWGGFRVPPAPLWTTLRSMDEARVTRTDVLAPFARHAIWCVALWTVTSAVGGATLWVDRWPGWIVLQASLLVLGGAPLALRWKLGLRGGQLAALALAAVVWVGGLAVGATEVGGLIDRVWRVPAIAGPVVAVLLGFYVACVAAAVSWSRLSADADRERP